MNKSLRDLYARVLPYEARFWFHKLRNPRTYRELRSRIYRSDKGDFSIKQFDECECIFIHITKTAGTSISLALFGYLPYHYTAIDYRVIYGRKTFNRYYKFAFVRNPWDRLYSAYRYLRAGGWNERDREWANRHLAAYDGFNEFVKQWLNRSNIWKHVHFMPQCHFVCDSKGRLLIDDCYYFETLPQDFERVCRHLKINASMGHHNASPHASYLEVYDRESREIVTNVYREDVRLFGYSFEGIQTRISRPRRD